MKSMTMHAMIIYLDVSTFQSLLRQWSEFSGTRLPPKAWLRFKAYEQDLHADDAAIVAFRVSVQYLQ
jgi:hypothetical protein